LKNLLISLEEPFDGYTYHWVNYTEIGDYTETNHLICRTEKRIKNVSRCKRKIRYGVYECFA